MSTLLLRLAAPIQSWGIDKFERRGTERVPTKSGVIGLVAAALGRRRNEQIDDLSTLRFGVRIDKEGKLLSDFHTAKSQKAAYVTERYYLADAVFLVGLEGEDSLLNKIEYALENPGFPLYLGRRSCPPEGQLSLGIRLGKELLQALKEEPWLVSPWQRRNEDPNIHLQIITDADYNTARGYLHRDAPISFDQAHRQYGFRHVSGTHSVTILNSESRFFTSRDTTNHDPMLLLGGE
ncbi:MAG: type I-E CRISPR-associated protein Cas5/CasD [Caldicoprobacterales bacterium]|jgi:CRISPR system Cascade subunit CasD